MARALIVGCGCRGRELGRALLTAGWAVRGATREPDGLPEIESAGLDAVQADPDRVATVMDHVADVTLLYWLLGSATGEPEPVAALHRERLERMLEELVDTPVRGFVYEAAGTVDGEDLERGAGIVREASRRWRIPAEIVRADPAEPGRWADAMVAAAERLTS